MSMINAMSRAVVLARRGLPAESIVVAGLSSKTIAGIVSRYGPKPRPFEGADIVKRYRIITPRRWRRNTLEAIMREVCEKHGMTESSMIGHRRTKSVVTARHELYYRAATETILSCAEIGRRLNRDHSSILHALIVYCAANGLSHPRAPRALDQKRAAECQ
jgi:hypothetical protein